MKKLLFILSIFIFSSCESKFDGLQGGIFSWAKDRVTFDDDKAYFTVSSYKYEAFGLEINLFKPNSKITDDFNKLFEKYIPNESFDFYLANKSFRYIEFNEEFKNLIGLSNWNLDDLILLEGNPENPTGKNVVDLSSINDFGVINNILRMNVEMLLNKIDYKQAEFSYSINGKNLNFTFDYEMVGQNQISLTKPTTKPNYSNYYEFKRELEILINKYESDGYIFGRKTILNIPSFIQGIENDYLKSNYYLNKVEKGYTLKNLEHTFFYYEQR